MATPSTSTIDMSVTSLSGMAGGDASTTTNLETVGVSAPATTSPLPVASGVGVNAPSVNPFDPDSVALLTLADTTVTAYAVPSTTGLAVLADSGATLTFRLEGTTLSDGDVVSLGFNGLVESTTTGTWMAYSGGDVSATPSLSSSYSLPTGPGPVIFNSSSVPAALTSGQATSLTTSTSSGSGGGGGGQSTAGSGGSGGSATQASASASGTADAAASLSAGKAAMLLGAVGGMVAWAL